MAVSCPKRVYRSRAQALQAHRRAGWRVRLYYCPACHGLHAANHEKAVDAAIRRARKRRLKG